MTEASVVEAEGRPGGLEDPSLYFNRELSWLEFNERVLELAEDGSLPLLERVKFAAIYSSNLDEFFMVRVAGLKDQIEAGVETPGINGFTARQTLDGIRERVLELAERQTVCFENHLLPALAEHGICVARVEDLTDEQRGALREHFRRVIFPALTPLAVGPGQPFPYISNLSLSLGVIVRDPISGHATFARVKVPIEILPRFLAVGESRTFVTLEDVIAHNLDSLFQGMEIVDYDVFRVSRDADLSVSDEAEDLLRAVEDELRRRRFGEVVRVEIGAGMSEALLDELTAALGVEPGDVYPIERALDMTGLWEIVKLPGHAELRETPWVPTIHPRFRADEEGRADVMTAMRDGDILVHHPYDSFTNSVERFVEQAVADANVLAIKQTVYRTSDDSPLVPALIRAAERGKQAVCLVELQARFDESTNIAWAKSLEQAGVHVVYGHPALKTHAKCVLVVRREGDGVRNYVHIGTGNYHSATARLYTDYGLFTTDPDIGQDVAELFNYLTGFGRPSSYRKVAVAPSHLREAIADQIERTIESHSEQTPARIVMKMNSLVDRRCIAALYRASEAGVRVDLNVRGICCLRPGLAGVSENITVVSLVGRFLEHSRVYAFERAGEHTVYIASADLMPRNLDTRVELAVPIESAELRADVLETMELYFADTRNAWELRSDGSWERRVPDADEAHDAQATLMRRHAARSAEPAKSAG
ncbi:MAG: polyphosphate kinase [Solirubrobacteraceae bacterium]|jgi:polyphosphate kinase|nr:polyphosphate kinase [Solirubrobacteraceae bacterium]